MEGESSGTNGIFSHCQYQIEDNCVSQCVDCEYDVVTIVYISGVG